MTPSEATAAIRARMETQWAVSNPSVPLYWQNDNNQLGDPPFLHLEVSFGAARIATLGGDGNNIHRQSGEVVIRVFGTSQDGVTEVGALADDAADAFRGYRSGDLRFYTAAPAGSGTQSGNLFQQDVIANFFFDLTG